MKLKSILSIAATAIVTLCGRYRRAFEKAPDVPAQTPKTEPGAVVPVLTFPEPVHILSRMWENISPFGALPWPWRHKGCRAGHQNRTSGFRVSIRIGFNCNRPTHAQQYKGKNPYPMSGDGCLRFDGQPVSCNTPWHSFCMYNSDFHSLNRREDSWRNRSSD